MAINPWLRAAGPAASTILRSGRVPDIRQFPIPGNMLLRRFGGTLDSNPTYEEEIPPEEELPLPPIPPERETVAPATTTNAGGAARPQNQGDESQETFDALREFQANLRGRHMTTEPQQQPLSVLDMLRKRMANAMENEQAQRISDLGTALLASRSPNFFTALGEGLAAQEAGSRTRMDQLRQIADLERQQRALDVEEARRQEEIRVREEELRLMAPYRAALTEQALASAAGLRAGRTASLTAANLRRVEQSASAALNNARLAASRETPPRTLTPAEETRIYREAEQRAIQTLQMQPQTSETPSPAPQVDIPTITPGGRPAR